MRKDINHYLGIPDMPMRHISYMNWVDEIERSSTNRIPLLYVYNLDLAVQGEISGGDVKPIISVPGVFTRSSVNIANPAPVCESSPNQANPGTSPRLCVQTTQYDT